MATSRFPHPHFHFTLDNWLNDVIPFWWDGLYHVCFDHNLIAPQWTQTSVWAHAVSENLTQWRRVRDALDLGAQGAPDAGGVWTGCLVQRDDGRFAALYTGIETPPPAPIVQRQCLAFSDDLIHWEKQGMILADGPAENADCWRDPTVWKDADGTWKMVIGGAHPDGKRGQILLYTAQDAALTQWIYKGVLMVGDDAAGRWCECPDFFPIGDQWLALCSMGKTWWYVGNRKDDVFVPTARGLCDESDSFYAAKTLVDGAGRRLLLGWIREGNSAEEREEAGWAGALSLPRIVTLGPDNRPRFAPPPELDALRGAYSSLAAGEEKQFSRTLEIQSSGPFSLNFAGKVRDFAPGRLYLDGTIIEHFAAEGTTCQTERVYEPGDAVTVTAPHGAEAWEVVSERTADSSGRKLGVRS